MHTFLNFKLTDHHCSAMLVSKNLLANSLLHQHFFPLCTGFNRAGATYHATPLYPSSPSCSLSPALGASEESSGVVWNSLQWNYHWLPHWRVTNRGEERRRCSGEGEEERLIEIGVEGKRGGLGRWRCQDGVITTSVCYIKWHLCLCVYLCLCMLFSSWNCCDSYLWFKVIVKM